MTTMRNFLKECWKITMPENPTDEWFKNHDVPMTMYCAKCGEPVMTTKVLIDRIGFIYCPMCARIE